MGMDATPLRLLQWSQLRIDGDRAWLVRLPASEWSSGETGGGDREEEESTAPPAEEMPLAGRPPLQLPADVWEAIQDYQRPGRLESMRPEDYLFPPVVNLYQANLAGKSCEWDSSRPLSKIGAISILQEYVQWAGLQAGKISWRNLHHTAFKLRMEAGEDEVSLHELMGKERLSRTREYLDDLHGHPKAPLWRDDETTPKVRRRTPRSPGRYPRHSLYARRLPRIELELFMQSMSAEEKIRLVEVYSMAISHSPGWSKRTRTWKGGKIRRQLPCSRRSARRMRR